MSEQPDDDADDLDQLFAYLDRELTRLYGPNHQQVLSTGGRLHSQFVWWDDESA